MANFLSVQKHNILQAVGKIRNSNFQNGLWSADSIERNATFICCIKEQLDWSKKAGKLPLESLIYMELFTSQSSEIQIVTTIAISTAPA